MTDILVDRRDVQFVLFDLLKVQTLAKHARFQHIDQEVLDILLEEAERFSEQRLFPLNIQGDKTGARYDAGIVRAVPGLREAYGEFVQGGWLTMSEDPALGGQGLPEIVKFAAHELFLAANFPFMCFVNLTHDAAKLIELFGTNDQRARYMTPMYRGDWTGTMCLTEPGAGSDVGALRTRARLAEDGTYRINGQKIYITNGEHDLAENIVHLVLARIEGDPDGTRGLSLFIVPKHRVNPNGSVEARNDIQCAGIESKMGLHASPTTTLVFGERDDCHGYLLGKRREGIRIMFHMMNQSRLEVGLFGLGVCSVSYRHALAYAKERVQGQGSAGEPGRVTIIKHPDVRRILMTLKAYTEGLRALLYYCAYAMDQAVTAYDHAAAQQWQEIVDLLIPVAKAHPTEKGVEMAALGIQVHGGAGYTDAYPLEQYLRDSKVACIFEGTTAIQAMDFALRKVQMKGGAVFKNFLTRMDDVMNRAATRTEWLPYVDQLRMTRNALRKMPETLTAGPEDRRLRNQLLSATPLLEVAGDLLVAYFLLWSALVAEEKLAAGGGVPGSGEFRESVRRSDAELSFLAGKIAVARYFIATVLPQVDGKMASIRWKDDSACSIRDSSF
ncbi:MAG: acyl-CoA dehydrogenase [Gemmatimonadaceae bacterium]|nr:acyl-CoA dehydrogenase [Gemmatimonadaceae bacterium]